MHENGLLELNKWAAYVRAHRLSQNLNQSQFAELIGVSQQTISRWESGSQIPEPGIQDKLRVQLRVTALNSTEFWRRRVASASSFDVLVASDLTILAASRRAKGLFGIDKDVSGANLAELMPAHELGPDVDGRVKSLQSFVEIGFFDGVIRSMRVDMDWHLPSGSCACKTDVWPVMTSDQVIIGHLSGSPTPIARDEEGFQGIRIRRVTVRLNKDAVDE